MKAQNDIAPQDVWAVFLDTTGHLGIRDRVNGVNKATSTGTLALNTPVRYETKCIFSGTVYTLTLRLFFGANVEGATPDETLTGTITNSNVVNVVAFGAQTATSQTWATPRHDDAGMSAINYLGSSAINGPGSVSLKKPSLSGSGTETMTGTGSVSLKKPALSGSGTARLSGTGSIGMKKMSLSGTSTLSGPRVRLNGQWQRSTIRVRINGQWVLAHPKIRYRGAWVIIN